MRKRLHDVDQSVQAPVQVSSDVSGTRRAAEGAGQVVDARLDGDGVFYAGCQMSLILSCQQVDRMDLAKVGVEGIVGKLCLVRYERELELGLRLHQRDG